MNFLYFKRNFNLNLKQETIVAAQVRYNNHFAKATTPRAWRNDSLSSDFFGLSCNTAERLVKYIQCCDKTYVSIVSFRHLRN